GTAGDDGGFLKVAPFTCSGGHGALFRKAAADRVEVDEPHPWPVDANGELQFLVAVQRVAAAHPLGGSEHSDQTGAARVRQGVSFPEHAVFAPALHGAS